MDWSKNLEQNAIPSYFDQLSYEDFLQERRLLMLNILKKYFEQLKNPNIQLEKVSLKERILIGENNTTEFKSSYKRDVRNQQVNDALKFQIIKTIAAFLNTD